MKIGAWAAVRTLAWFVALTMVACGARSVQTAAGASGSAGAASMVGSEHAMTPPDAAPASALSDASATTAAGSATVDGGAGYVQIAAGPSMTCGTTSAGTVRCTDPVGSATLAPTLQNPTQIALGFAHSCARLRDGTIRCWGHNACGQCGDDTTISREAPVQVEGLEHVAEIDVGDAHSCARMEDATIRCWGANDDGELGQGATNRQRPAMLPGFDNVTSIALGAAHTCVRRADASVWCWGRNDHGQVGDGTVVSRRVPVRVRGVDHAARVFATNDRTCAVTEDGTLWCWGANYDGRTGRQRNTLAPTRVAGITGVAEVAGHEACVTLEGANVPTCHQLLCARTIDSRVRCWGGSVDRLQPRAPGPIPEPIEGLSAVREISASGDHEFRMNVCARSESGDVSCWVYDHYTVRDVTDRRSVAPVPW